MHVHVCVCACVRVCVRVCVCVCMCVHRLLSRLVGCGWPHIPISVTASHSYYGWNTYSPVHKPRLLQGVRIIL